MEPAERPAVLSDQGEREMGRYLLLGLLGVPLPILLPIRVLGGLQS
jgi:hypothetical protein